MRNVALAVLVVGTMAMTPALGVSDTLQADQTITFTDGSVANTYAHCGDTDLCARVTYQNGETLSIYSEGAAYCQPYILHFVLVDGSRTVYEYSRTINHDLPATTAFGTHCGNSQTTQMVMDHGFIHMSVSENNDGTLSVTFTATGKKLTREQPHQESGAPTPTPSS